MKVADQFKAIFDKNKPMDEETGRQMAQWANGQDSAGKTKATLDAARDAARNGTDAFRQWWKDNADQRALANTIMDDLKAISEAADKADGALGDDPFADDSPAPDGDIQELIDRVRGWAKNDIAGGMDTDATIAEHAGHIELIRQTDPAAAARIITEIKESTK